MMVKLAQLWLTRRGRASPQADDTSHYYFRDYLDNVNFSLQMT